MEAALTFLDSFPEAQAWHITVLDQQKVHITNAERMSPSMVRRSLQWWLGLRSVHIFVRPLLSNLVFLDLDNFEEANKDLSDVIQLQPRAVVRSPPGNHQAWYTIPEALASKNATWIAQCLNVRFAGDERSLKPGQQGRLPGSMNVKQGKRCMTELIYYSAAQHMNEKRFLEITAQQKVTTSEGELTTKTVGPKSKQIGADRSGSDWKMCCEYLEQHPDVSLETATQELMGRLSKEHPRPDWYYKTTVTKAWERVRQWTSAAGSSPPKCQKKEEPASELVLNTVRIVRCSVQRSLLRAPEWSLECCT
jgi:hypothetical protein